MVSASGLPLLVLFIEYYLLILIVSLKVLIYIFFGAEITTVTITLPEKHKALLSQ